MPAGSTGRIQLTVFAVTLILSAALLFNIQPMIGKQLLPRVGGTPQAWNIAMAFFQLSLLGGYVLAHALSRLSIRQHALAYLCALAAAMLFLPVSLPSSWQPAAGSILPLSLLYILITNVAVPFIALSLSAPTLQRLFSGTQHQQAKDPYFLYVASNLGSLTGLLAYPFLIEPALALADQALLWQYGFFALAGMGLLCFVLQGINKSNSVIPDTPVAASIAPSWRQRGRWVGLSFIPSSLTLGVTTYISTDLTPAPLLWVMTLALYLLSFMLAFATRVGSLRQLCHTVYPWLAGFAALGVLVHINMPWPMVIISLTAFFTTATACHSLLAASRPDARHLTDFYLWLSVGGALGGSFNAFVAPVIFNQLTEYPLVLLLAILASGTSQTILKDKLKLTYLLTFLFVLVLASLVPLGDEHPALDIISKMILMTFLATLIPLLRLKHVAMAAAAVVFMAFFTLKPYLNNNVFIDRNFFGTVTVSDRMEQTTGFKFRLLEHGTTAHGIQMIAPQRSTIPTGYYAPTGPLALIWSIRQPQSVALIGLGAGSLNCYGKPGQDIHFIEIDPLVVEVAQKYFTFLSECPPPRISIGDGRLVMAADTQKYDLIVVDAFSSDAIPVHIVTREAIALYVSRLNPGGVIALHTSSRFFNLEPVLAAIAADLNLSGYIGKDTTSGIVNNVITFPSEAIILAPDAASLQILGYQAKTWRRLRQKSGITAWTDSYSNIVSSIKATPSIAPLHEP